MGLYIQHRLRQRAGGHVPIRRRPAQQGVPHRAADAPGLIARRLQTLQERPYILRHPHRSHLFLQILSFSGYSSKKTGIVSIEL